MKFFRPNQPLISVWIARYITFSYAPRCTSAPTSGGLIFTVPIFGAKTGCKHRPKVLVKYGDGLFLSPGLDGPGSNPGGGRGFPPAQTGPGAHPASCKMGTGSFPGVNCGRGVLLTTHPLLVPRSWKSRAIPPPTLWATPVLLRDHFTFLPEAVVTVLCTPGDGCGWHLYHELWTCRVINRLLCVGSRWTSIISDARNKKRKI